MAYTPPFNLRHKLLFCACALPSFAHAASFEPAAAGQPRLEEVQVTATRLPRRLDEIAGTVTVVDEAAIARQVANDLRDLARYQPGIVMDSASRGGNQGFSIRGIGGNRVLMLIDGVRSADIYAAGPSSYGKDMFEVDDLKAVEIIRGPASVLYGADAMGGAVLLSSKAPADYLGDADFSLGLRSSAASDNDEYKLGATLAARHGDVSQVLQATVREFAEREVNGPGQLNPQDGERQALMWKGVWQAAVGHRLEFTAEWREEEILTRIDSDLGSSVQSSTGEDSSTRTRFGLRYDVDLDSHWADSLNLSLQQQDTDATQYSEQLRTSYSFIDPRNPASFAGTQALRHSDFRFDQRNQVLQANLTKAFAAASSAHTVVYGFSLERTDTERPRDRFDMQVATGEVTRAIPSYPMAPPEVFPNKTFPDTLTSRLGLFVQDEIRLPGDRLVLIPGLRYTRYEMDPSPDALLNGSGDIADYGGYSVVAVEEHDTSFNLGMLYSLNAELSLFAQYSQGFRPPNFDESNQAFVNLGHGYATIPNPGLRAESSRGLEVGLRGNYADWRFTLAAFDNRYHDFIDSVDVGVANGVALFQDANVGRARIHGAEASVQWLMNAQWSLHAALAFARGEDRESSAPLNSVDPLNGNLGLRYQTAGGRFELEGILSWATDQDRVSAADRARGEAWQTLDLIGRYDIGSATRLRFGVFNIFDAEYAPWSSIRGLAADDTTNIANAHAPGIHARVGLDHQF